MLSLVLFFAFGGAALAQDVDPLVSTETEGGVPELLEEIQSPGGTGRNIASAGKKIGPATELQQKILCDPQTSGGLLVAVDERAEKEFHAVAAEDGLVLESIGRVVESGPGPLLEIS